MIRCLANRTRLSAVPGIVLFPLAVFVMALTVRLIYLIQSTDFPTFFTPVVDSETYHQLALRLAAGEAVGDDLFWQPIYYPSFLALVYRVFGPSIRAAKIIQAVAGALACALVYLAGRVSFSHRVGLIAGVITAFYGPLIFFESELIGEGWAVFWVVSILLLCLLAEKEDHPLLFAALGVCGALGILTRPPLLIFFAIGCAGFTLQLRRRMTLHQTMIRLGLLLVGFLLITAHVARLNQARTGHFGILPHSSGINLYVGNNPDWEQTVTARPGYEWQAICRLAREAGITNVWESSRFYRDEVATYVRRSPRLFARGIGLKTVRFISSRELPRNVDIYLFRRWSSVLSALVWKVGGFGFPLGLIGPLAVLGLWTHRRRIPPLMWALILIYPFTIISYFVAARYRIPMMPAFAILAACGATSLWDNLLRRRWSALGLTALCLASMAFVMSIPASFAEERVNYEAEIHRALGYGLAQKKAYAEAIPHLQKAIDMEPTPVNALNDLSNVYFQLERYDDARKLSMDAIAVSPRHAGAHYNLGLIHLEQGVLPEAELYFRKAIDLEPRINFAHLNLGVCLARQGDLKGAIAQFRAELDINPRHAPARTLLNRALASPVAQQMMWPTQER